MRPRDSLAATAKHLCAYGAVTAGREYASADVSERTLHEIYLPPFAAAVAARGRGDHAGVHRYRRRADDRQRQAAARLAEGSRSASTGVLISDYNAVAELLNHGVAADLVEAAALALNAGVDIDMTSGAYIQGLPEALKRGLVTMAAIDASVRRVLELKERLGLFDDPYRRGSAAPRPARAAERRELAREAARRAIVLMTNRAQVLPLSPEIAAHRRHWPAGRGAGRDAGVMGFGGPPRGRRVHSGRAQGGSAAMPDRSRRRRRHRGTRHGRNIGRRRPMRRGRNRRAVPWRERGDERRGGEPNRSRPAWAPARARRGGP